MKCAACGAESTVLESRKRDGGTYRRRMCPACGCRFSTMETIMHGLKTGPRPSKPAPAPKPAKPKAARPAARRPAPARRLDDYWMRGEPHDYQDDLREAGIDTTHFG